MAGSTSTTSWRSGSHEHQVRWHAISFGAVQVRPLVPALVRLPTLPAGPGPSGSAGPSLRCQDCSRLSPHLRGSAVLSFIRPLRRPVVGLTPHPVTVRSTRGALSVLPPVGFPGPPPEPGVRRKAHRALRTPGGLVVGLMLCSATVLGCVFPGSSSAWRAPWPGRTAPRHRRRAICRSIGVAPSTECADACALAT